MSVIDTTPLGTQAGIVDRVLAQPDPARRRIALPTIASNYDMSLADLQALLHHYGYPDTGRMRTALERLTAAAKAAVTDDAKPTNADPDGEIPSDTTQMRRIPLTKLHPDPDNVRTELVGIDDLADSMRENGLIQPLVARRDGTRLVLVAGHRRYAAAKLLRWTDIEVVIRHEMKPADVIAAMLIENGQRTDLDPIDEARGLNALKTIHGYSDVELGRRIGRSQPYVSARIALLSLSAEEQDQVRNGEMKLIEATHRGRLNSGKVQKAGQSKNWHLGPQHNLSDRVKARCQNLGHPKGRTVGGMGCGACWEEVIRASEREEIQRHSALKGCCASCGHLITIPDVPQAV